MSTNLRFLLNYYDLLSSDGHTPGYYGQTTGSPTNESQKATGKLNTSHNIKYSQAGVKVALLQAKNLYHIGFQTCTCIYKVLLHIRRDKLPREVADVNVCVFKSV